MHLESAVPRRSRRLATRLAMVVALALVVVVGGAGWAAVSATASAYRDEALQRAAAMLTTLAGPAALAVADSTFDRLDGFLCEAVRPTGADVELVAVVTMDTAGRAVAASTDAIGAPLVPGQPLAVSQQFAESAGKSPDTLWRRFEGAGGRVYVLVSVPAVSGLRWGTLIGVFDLSLVEDRIDRTLLYVLALVVGAAGLLALVTYAAFSRLAVRPMQELAHAAESIRRGQRDRRLNWRRKDELGLMAASFDHMADEVERFTTGLQVKVAERSAEVEARNRDLQRVNAQLRTANAELERLAHVDPLTAVANRRSFDSQLLQLADRRSPQPFALLMCDIDHFKRINDSHGHPIGDIVLREVARALSAELRGSDRIARYGGEEFILILANAGAETAVEVARRLVHVVGALQLDELCGVPIGVVTISIGVAVAPEDGSGPAELITRSDAALYAAKTGGRNQAVRWTAALDQPAS